MKALMLLALCAAAAMGATVKTKEVEGKEVIPGPRFPAFEFIEVAGVTFYSCKLAEKSQPCTIITGTITTHLPNDNWVVYVDFNLVRNCGSLKMPQQSGGARATIERPAPDKAVKFTCIAPDLKSLDAVLYCYQVTTSYKVWKPPVPPPLPKD